MYPIVLNGCAVLNLLCLEIGYALCVSNKPTCARVAAMTTLAHNTSKQLFANAKVNFSILLPYA